MKKRLNEAKRMQELAGLLREDDASDIRADIETWYLESNPDAEKMSLAQIQNAVEQHYKQFMATKDNYGNDLIDYLDDVENRGDWFGGDVDY